MDAQHQAKHTAVVNIEKEELGRRAWQNNTNRNGTRVTQNTASASTTMYQNANINGILKQLAGRSSTHHNNSDNQENMNRKKQ